MSAICTLLASVSKLAKYDESPLIRTLFAVVYAIVNEQALRFRKRHRGLIGQALKHPIRALTVIEVVGKVRRSNAELRVHAHRTIVGRHATIPMLAVPLSRIEATGLIMPLIPLDTSRPAKPPAAVLYRSWMITSPLVVTSVGRLRTRCTSLSEELRMRRWSAALKPALDGKIVPTSLTVQPLIHCHPRGSKVVLSLAYVFHVSCPTL